MKQLNLATCTKPSAVHYPSYSTITSSQTSTDKTACNTTKQPPSKIAITTSTNPNFDQMDVKQIKALISVQHVQVSIYHKPVLIQLVRAVAFVDLPTDPDCFQWDKKFGHLPNGIIVQCLLPAPSIWTNGHF